MATTLFVKHTVSDYDRWKHAYDGLGPVRKEKFGVSHASVHRDSHDPNTIVITHRFNDAQTAMAFANSDELKSAMSNAGILSPPEAWFTDDVEQTTF
jgi:quinol monooxygenase YgiN